MPNPPVPYTPSVEAPTPDEPEMIARLKLAFDQIIERTHEDYGHAVRSVHAKAHGVLRGEMMVRDDLPPELAQGLFARLGRHAVLMRLSTNAGDILPDAISLPRGIAIKVLDVEGERLPGSEGSAQDFVMVNSPVFQSRTAGKFLGGLQALARTTDRMEGAKKAVSTTLRGVRSAFEAVGVEPPAAVNALGGARQSEPLGQTYWSTVPFRYGAYIAKFSLMPVTSFMLSLAGEDIALNGRDNAIREEVRQEASRHALAWDFRAQLCRDLEKQPVEDPTIPWDEDDAPFVTVATITMPAQDSWDPVQVQAIDEETRFSVWTGLAAHQPLGNINRARRETYRHSADRRAALNGCPYHEPADALKA